MKNPPRKIVGRVFYPLGGKSKFPNGFAAKEEQGVVKPNQDFHERANHTVQQHVSFLSKRK
jgi:hypothetical protein